MKVSQKLFDIIPNITVKNPKVLKSLNKVGDIMGRPMQNRLILGATAIISQPLIDSHNKRVDKDTARASRNRTVGRIIAGTTVGCIVRECVYKLIGACTKEELSVEKWSNFLTPRKIQKMPKGVVKNLMRNYRTVLATVVGMIVMLGTNVFCDVPLTNLISNALNKRDAKKKEEMEKTIQDQKPPVPHNSKEAKTRIEQAFNINKGGTK